MPFLKEKNVCLLRTNHSISVQMSLNSSTPGFLRCGESVSSTLHPELALSSHRNERSRKETKGLSLPSWLLAADLQQPAWPSKAVMSCSLGQNAQPWREGCDNALLKCSFSRHLNRVPGFVFATALKVPAEVFALQPHGHERSLQCPHKARAGPGTLALERERQAGPWGITSQLVWFTWWLPVH